MKIRITIVLFFIISKAFPQQYNFNQLVEMTRDMNSFEIKMIRALNFMYRKDKRDIYQYQTSSEIGSSLYLPTNDARYEPKYRFENGIIYTDSEIDDLKIDESHEIRNRLIKQGGLIKETTVDRFIYIRNKLTSIIKVEMTNIGFAENYLQEEKTAITWYKWERIYQTKILSNSKFLNPNSKKLTVQYGRNSDFSKILNQIIAESKYIDTQDVFGSFISNYKYKNYLITSNRDEEGHGGIITILIKE